MSTPMRLLCIPEPFDHPDFLFEPKIDGFRALAYVRGHRCELVLRNSHVFKSWPQLSEEIAHAVRCSGAVLDGEICCLRPDGRSDFRSLLFRRGWPYFYAFDLIALNGRDLRLLPLLERKRRPFAIMPRVESRVLYLDHIHERGVDLFREACRARSRGHRRQVGGRTYQADSRGTSWLKIKNPEYSQIDGRRELFEARRDMSRRRSPVRPPMLGLV
jgi:bifunctional non-homologous end joining protein LigD